jgi:hypothetical protein
MSKKTILWATALFMLLAITGFFFVALTQWAGVIYLPSGTETVGNFSIKSYKTEGFGHTSVRRTLYYHGHKLGENLAGLVPSPIDGERAIYERYCNFDKPAEQCGLFYFDGHARRSYLLDVDPNISLVNVYPEFAVESHYPWSPDGRFVVIQEEYRLLLVDLQTGGHTDLAQRLDAQASQHPQPPRRQAHFVGWSPDMREAAVLLSTNLDDRPQEIRFRSDLYSVDLERREPAYRCTVGPYRLDEIQYGWQRSGDRFKMQLSAKNKKSDIRIYDKNTKLPCS